MSKPACAVCQNFDDVDEDKYCQICIDDLIKKEENLVDRLQNDLSNLQSKSKKISSDKKTMEQLVGSQEDMNSIISKERSIVKEIEDLEQKEKQQNERLAQLKQNILQLEKNEDDLWSQINKFSRKLFQLFENSQIADNTLEQLNSELERLNKIDIVNDLFRISVQDDVAVLNGITVGKKSDQQIDWDEMNAALGHLCVIILYLMKKFGYVYQKQNDSLKTAYKQLYAMEAHQPQQIKRKSNSICKHVFNKPPSQIEEDTFNDAFICLFTEFGFFCRHLQDADFLKKRKIQLNINFKFNGQMIADKSINLKSYFFIIIRYQNNKWDNWTDAVKRFFANVKSVISMNSQFDLAIQQEETAMQVI